MTTVDITCKTGQNHNKEHKFLIGKLFELELSKLLIIKTYLEALESNWWLKETEKTWQK